MKKRLVTILIFLSVGRVNTLLPVGFAKSFFRPAKQMGFVVASIGSYVHHTLKQKYRKRYIPPFLLEGDERNTHMTSAERSFVEDLIAERAQGDDINVDRLDSMFSCSSMMVAEKKGGKLQKKIVCMLYPPSLITFDCLFASVKKEYCSLFEPFTLSEIAGADYVDAPLCMALEYDKQLKENNSCQPDELLRAKNVINQCLIRHKASIAHEIGHCIDEKKHPSHYVGWTIPSVQLAITFIGYSLYAGLTKKANLSTLKEIARSTGVVASLRACNKGLTKYVYNVREYAADDYVTDEHEMRILKNTLLVYEERRRLCLSETMYNFLDHMPGGWRLYDTWRDFEHPSPAQRIARIDRRLQEMGCVEG